MTKPCQEYLSNVKALMPIVGKTEKKYLANLSELLEDYCEEENVATLEDLYHGFGGPNETINAYLNSMDTSCLVKRIRIAAWVKRGIIVLILVALIGVGIYGIKSYQVYKIWKQESVFSVDTIIEDVDTP